MEQRHRSSQILSFAAAGLLLFMAGAASAGSGDVDLFSGGADVPPNILLLIDNSGSMDKDVSGNACSGTCDSRREIATAAIGTLINAVNPVDVAEPSGRKVRARFGLMTYRSKGATVEEPIGDNTSDNVITDVAALTSRSVGTPIDGSILDAGRYLAGSNQWGTLPVWGTLTPDETTLANPIDLACRDSFILFITDGIANDDEVVRTGFWDTVGDSDDDDGVGEDGAENVAVNVANDNIEWGDDITWSMARRDFRPDLDGTQSVFTHVIGFTVDDDSLERMAENGKGEYYTASNAAQLATALSDATAEVFDRYADFASAVVPTSRTLAGSAFYNAFFEPDKEAFWPGRLEAYRLSDSGDILDEDGDPAIDSVTGQLIDPHDPYWEAGEELIANNARDIYTTIGGARADFETTNVSLTEGLLNIGGGDPAQYSGSFSTSQLRDALIDYLHGTDVFDDNEDGSRTDRREAVLGDIFHSTPRVVARPSRLLAGEDGYDAFYTANRDRHRVIYAGANDGMLHAFDAGVVSSGNDPETPVVEDAGHEYYSTGFGTELFAWVPGSLLPTLKMVPRNYPRTFYYVDGSPVHAEAWLGDLSGSDIDKTVDEWATVLITPLREGGNTYLALDVTDPSDASYPEFLWEFSHAKLGQAWSEPVITRVRLAEPGATDKCGYDDGDGDCREQWVAIFGGGYLPEGNPNLGSWQAVADGGWTEQSKAIFIVALDSGNVLAKIDYDSHSSMIYSVPSTPAVADLDQDGFADVIYVGDLGGQLWKWDISAVGVDSNSDLVMDNWPAAVFFNSARADMGGGNYHYRSFFNPPGLAYHSGIIHVSFGSGERESLRYPGVAAKDDNNRFFVVKDRYPVGPLAFIDENAVVRPAKTEANLTDVTSIKVDSNALDSGYFFVAEEGEKFTSDVVIFAGYVITTSYIPSGADLCTAATGESFLYVFKLYSSSGFYDYSGATAVQSRRNRIGSGLASSPRISMGDDPSQDRLYVKTSKSKIVPVIPPQRDDSGASTIYWRQNY